MKLKTKLTLSISGLVLLVVLAVNLVYWAGNVHEQMQETYSHADFLSQELYNELSQELSVEERTGKLQAADPAALQSFFQSRRSSPAMATLLSSAIGYNSAIRDAALVAPDGRVAMDSNPLLEGQMQPQRRLMSEIMRQRLWDQIKAILGPEQTFAVSLATEVGAQPLGTITVGVDTVLLRQAVIGRLRQLAWYGGVVLLLATGLAWGLADLALAPLTAISAELDRLTAAASSAALPPLPTATEERHGEAHADDGDEFGVVSSKIQRLGQQIEDARQVYSTLQENVGHVLEGLEEGLLLFDANGQSVMASAAAPRLLGLADKDLVGRPVEALFPGQSGLDRTVRQAVRQKTAMASRDAERHAGGRPLLARLDLVRDRGGQMGSLLTLRDAEPVYRLENELEVARRLSAVGRLTRGVAHEVKNPLNAMAIHLDLLREKAGPGTNGLQPHIQVIGREIERLDRVVRTFLDFSRPVELKLAAADLSEVARGVAQLVWAGAAAQGIAIALSAPDPGPRVWLDRDLVEQALLNLVNNGMQAMQSPTAETAELPPRAAAAAGGGRPLRIEVFEDEPYGVIRVRDQGPGIPAEHRDKIFDLYFTTRREGTGIGLALAARIMQLHHGAIELEDGNEGTGASFLLRFPIRESEAGA